MDYLIIALFALLVAMILSSAVVLAVCIRHQKRWEKAVVESFSALYGRTETIAKMPGEIDKRMLSIEKKLEKNIDDNFNAMNRVAAHEFKCQLEFQHQLQEKIDALQAAVTGLKSDLSTLALDYSQAQRAAGKINDFAATLGNIFDYDPIEARRKSRKESGGGM